MVRVLEQYQSSKFEKVLEKVELRFQGCPKEKWDERTFYITVSLYYKNDSQVCDIIYLIDRDDFTAAFSINQHYPKVRAFFLKHFRHCLSYSDEMTIAKHFTKTKEFQTSLEEFTNRYPKYISRFQSTL